MEKKVSQNISNEWETLMSIKKIIFSLNKENVSQSARSLINKINDNYPLSFNIILCHMSYSLLANSTEDPEIYMNFLNEIESLYMERFIFEDKNKIESIFDIFGQLLLRKNNIWKSCYLLEQMIEHGFLDQKIIQNLMIPNFVHYMSRKNLEKTLCLKSSSSVLEIINNIEELSKNDWELHKKYLREGVNPNELAKIIRNDEIEKLQEISSQTNFNFKQRIDSSIYERCEYISDDNLPLIDYAAFFGSVKCFKYLLINNANVGNTAKCAIAGGNLEIIHLYKQNHNSFIGSYNTAIKFHRNDIFKYIFENKFEENYNLEKLGKKCVLHDNYEILSYLQENGMKINDDIFNEAAKIGNLYLVKHFLKFNQIPTNILAYATLSYNIELVKNILEYKEIDINAKNDYGFTAIIWASWKGYIKIVNMLLQQEGIDVNAQNDYGETALICATIMGYTEIVKLLLEKEGIDINHKVKYGYTALIFASQEGHTEIVRLLLEQKGIDVNAQICNDGETALMIASENGNIEIVKLLLEKEGINIDIKDKFGKTALDYAIDKNYVEIPIMLSEHKRIDNKPKELKFDPFAIVSSNTNENNNDVFDPFAIVSSITN